MMAQKQKLTEKEKHLILETAMEWLAKWRTDPFVRQIDYSLDQGHTRSSKTRPRKIAANGTYTLTIRVNGGAHDDFV